MKRILIYPIVFFSFVFFYCSDENINESKIQDRMSFYFLKDPTISANYLYQNNVDILKLELQPNPFLTSNEIKYYKWNEHLFAVDSVKKSSIKSTCQCNPNLNGLPFLITIYDERIYLGAFWFEISSIPPQVPFIEVRVILEDSPDIFVIKKPMSILSPDTRGDERIFNFLKKNNLLID